MVGASATTRRSFSSFELRMRSGLRSSRARLSARQRCLVLVEIRHQGIAIGLPAFPVAERVDLQHGLAGDAEGLQDVPAAGDHLGVGQRLGRADQLDVDLMELAVAALLRTLVAEHRAGAEHLLRQRLSEAIGHQCAADARGGLRAEGDGIAAAVLEAVHFLRHHVRGLSQGAGEHSCVFEDGGGPLVEAIDRGDAAGGIDHELVAALVVADQVVGAAGGLEFGHGRFRFVCSAI